MPYVIVIGGSDPLGHSGLQADLRHLGALGCSGGAIPTCLTEQGAASVERVLPVPADHVERVLALAFQETSLDAIKIGLLHRPKMAKSVGALLRELLGLRAVPVILDPVLAASSGEPLVEPGTAEAILEHVLPVSTVVTPNRPELSLLAGLMGVRTDSDPAEAAAALRAKGAPWVLAKGGHALDDATTVTDRLFGPASEHTFRSVRVTGLIPRGTGCALSTALAAAAARGLEIPVALARARAVVAAAISRAHAARERRLVIEPGAHFTQERFPRGPVIGDSTTRVGAG